jgi:predicted RNA-binding protein
MCQAVVYLAQGEREQEIMRDVILLEPVEDGLRLQALFEEPVIVQARLAGIDFLRHRVMLVPSDEE